MHFLSPLSLIHVLNKYQQVNGSNDMCEVYEIHELYFQDVSASKR
jgi:hypothetical protein